MVEYSDGSIIAEIGTADMKRYTQHALFYPQRKMAKVTSFTDLINKKMSFEKAPYKKFPGLRLGFKALKAGGTMPAVLHGADDTAVRKFIKGEIKFTEIAQLIENTMDKHQVIVNPNLEQILMAEKWGRENVN